MIQPVSEDNRRQFIHACTHERVFGSKCLNSLQCYGTDHENVRLFVALTPDGEGSAALYLSDGVLVVSSDNRVPAAVFADFIRRQNIHEVDTNLAQCNDLLQLLGGQQESSHYMAYQGDQPQGDFSQFFPCTQLEDAFSVLQQSHAYYRTHLQFAPWAADIRLRCSHGVLELYQLNLDGKPVGTGSIASQDDECGVLAAVAVIPSYRRQGLGMLFSRFLTARVMEMEKTPRLISGYDAVADLYRKVGFVSVGRWGELYL